MSFEASSCDQQPQRVGHFHLAPLCFFRKQSSEHLLEVHFDLFHADVRDDAEGHDLFPRLEINGPVVELSFPQLLPELFTRGGVLFLLLRGRGLEARRGPDRRQEKVQKAFFGHGRGLFPDLFRHFTFHHVDADFREVADDGVDIAAHVAHLGKLGGFDLEERRLDEPRESPGDLGLAYAGRPDHDDILRHDLVPELFGKALAPPAVPERDGDGPLGVMLSDDILVEFLDDLPRCKGVCSKKPPVQCGLQNQMRTEVRRNAIFLVTSVILHSGF